MFKTDQVLNGQNHETGQSGKVHLFIEEMKPDESPTMEVEGRTLQIYRPLEFWRSIYGSGDGLVIPNTHGPGAFTVAPEVLARWKPDTRLRIRLRFVND